MEVTLGLAARCDLSAIDDPHDLAWVSVGKRPKSFIKALLVLDEETRLTARQALLHPWFTVGIYSAEFEAVYQRAIRDWKPFPPRSDHVKYIDTNRLPSLPPDEMEDDVVEEHHAETPSHYFELRASGPNRSI